MTKTSSKALFLLAAALGAVLAIFPGMGSDAASGRAAPAATHRPLDTSPAQAAPAFVPNVGQTDANVRYAAQGPGYGFFFTSKGVTASLIKGKRGAALELSFLGGRPTTPTPELRTAEKVNYVRGGDRRRWLTGLPAYGRLVYRDVWPGIDVRFRGAAGTLKYEFLVQPGAKPDDISLAWRGARGLSLDGRGNLVVGTPLGALRDLRPVSYQHIHGKRVGVPSRFALAGSGNAFGLDVGSFDATRPLVVDPGLIYSTLLGGSGFEQGRGIAVDPLGNAVVTGLTTSTDFPTTVGAFDPTLGDGQDAFVTKFNAAGSERVFSTYLGGATSTEAGFAVALDSTGGVLVTGTTASTDFPATGGFDTTYGGSGDAFVTRLSAAGTLTSSTYLGGGGNDQGFGIAVDALGSPIATGVTASSGFPTTPLAFDTSWNGVNDAFVTKLAPTLSSLVYSTFLGGTGNETGQGVALDLAGRAITTGVTASAGFPTTPLAYDTSANGLEDVFVTKLDATGSALEFSTFIGASGSDQGFGIAVDRLGAPVVTGYTGSTLYPTTPGSFDQTYNGGTFDAIVTKLDPTGATLLFSTFLGGASTDQAFGVALDVAARPTVTGTTSSSGWPTTPGAFDTSYNGNGDAFATRLSTTGTSLVYSTFLGGSSIDNGFAIAVDSAAAGYVTGMTFPFGATSYPTTPGAFDTTPNGQSDAFVTKLDLIGAPFTLDLEPATAVNTVDETHCVTATVRDFGGQPVPGVTVRFAVPTATATHATPSSGSAITDANGEAEFCFTARLPGEDLIHAFADANNDGDEDAGEPFDEATKTWVVPASTDCKISVGGSITAANGDRATFGGSAKLQGTEVQGNQEYRDHGPLTPRRVRSIELLAITCTGQSGSIFGTATIDGSGTFNFRVDVTDAGEPGTGDTYGILMSDGYASGQQPLDSGNIQVSS